MGEPAAPASDAARLLRLLDYALPEELIAQHPAARREDARLLVVERASARLTDSRFAELGRWLRTGDTLVVNETRVLAPGGRVLRDQLLGERVVQEPQEPRGVGGGGG